MTVQVLACQQPPVLGNPALVPSKRLVGASDFAVGTGPDDLMLRLTMAGLAANEWELPNYNITLAITQFCQYYVAHFGKRPTVAVAGDNVITVMALNDYVQEYLLRHPKAAANFFGHADPLFFMGLRLYRLGDDVQELDPQRFNVYADWLEEQGEPAAAAKIRMEYPL